MKTAFRLAVSLGGDSDTIACIMGGIAEAFYGHIPEEIFKSIWPCLPDDFQQILQKMVRPWGYPLAGISDYTICLEYLTNRKKRSSSHRG